MSDYKNTNTNTDTNTDTDTYADAKTNITNESKSITLEKYQYHLGISNNNLFVKAIEYSSLYEYMCVVSSDAIASYRLVDSMQTLRDIIEDRLIKKTFDNDFSVEYDVQKDRIIIKIMLRYMKIEETIILILYRTSMGDEELTVSNKSYHNDRLADYDNNKLIAKVSEFEKLVNLMRQEIDTLKMETQHSKYIVDVNYYLNGWKNAFVDIRNIVDIEFFQRNDHINVRMYTKNLCNKLTPMDMGCIKVGKKDSLKNDENAKKREPFGFLSKLTSYEGCITLTDINMEEINIFDHINKCDKIKELKFDNCYKLDIEGVLNFRELQTLKIKSRHVYIRDTGILDKHESLKTLIIDAKIIGTDTGSRSLMKINQDSKKFDIKYV